ncbi:hypothetical protein F5Y16DRAFT_409363 [Xylariaceae sp. FL0255]|nr:hypothetical protein F5Y16DRAFT_409363 [Xylariaceae sp. FL0255]
MSVTDPICQALNLSDGKPCAEIATVWDNLFCRFHGKQCHGLYAGYKKRNSQLDGMAEQAPEYLRSADTPLANDTFETVEDDSTLKKIHAHLFNEYVLLGKVIDARKLHHKHFYPMKLDYGHQAYLDTLSNRRHIVLRSLERVVKRMVEVSYAKEKWFEWIGEVQLEEELTREKDAKKAKLEAAMFKRHSKKVQARLRSQREKEDKQRQEAFLESAYQERMSAATEEVEDIESWDPIEDILEDERSRYIDLIRHFLWMEILKDELDEGLPKTATVSDTANAMQNLALSDKALGKKPKKKSKSKTAKSATRVTSSIMSNALIRHSGSQGAGQSRILAMMESDSIDEDFRNGKVEPGNYDIETEEEMRKRLKEGVEKNYDDVYGPILVGSLETPHGTHEKTPPLEDDEIETLIKDVREIKILLFCRLLLSHASLLPAALRAASVEEFLNDTQITAADLRDLCLKVEQPSLQDIRDACADLVRENEPETEETDDYEYEELTYEELFIQDRRFGHLQDPLWFYQNMYAKRCKALGKPIPSLKEFLRDTPEKPERMKVQICGKSIWNYSSRSSMSRQGWLQFSVLAKDCDLRHAMELCRNWNEFLRLSFLASWQYFPAGNWLAWGTDRLTKQLHDLSFFPFFFDLDAKNASRHFQTGGSRSQQRRAHDIVEARNVIAGQMKRNDSVTRRFLQYLSMRTGEVLLAVRDGRTGAMVTAPHDEDALWTCRSKRGLGRASKNEWNVELEIGPEYFEFASRFRNWHLGFDDYYEVWIWHLVPGEDGVLLYNVVADTLRKAWRVVKPVDIYNHQEPLLRTLTRNEQTKRVRMTKPGEQVKTVWDEVMDPRNIFMVTDMTNKKVKTIEGKESAPHSFYSDGDAAEDAILFPDELVSANRNVRWTALSNSLSRMESGAGTLSKYVGRLLMEEAKSQQKGSKLLDAGSDTDESLESGDSIYDLEYDDSFSGDKLEAASDEGSDATKHWRLPPLWSKQSAKLITSQSGAKKKKLISNIGLLDKSTGKILKCPTIDEFGDLLKNMDRTMLMEKDRGDAIIEAFHAGDLEPGAPEKYQETCAIIDGILDQEDVECSQAWLWFALEILDWLNVRADWTEYTHVGAEPFPHPFVTQDILKAWAHVAIFFPELEQSQPATEFFRSGKGQKYHASTLLDSCRRAANVPSIRTKTSFKYRPKKFWKEWDDIVTKARETGKYYADMFSPQWDIATRPILAKHLRLPTQSLIVDYADRLHASGFPDKIPGLVEPHDFPVFLPIARKFAAKNPGARFAVLRGWSAPHFYPAMIGQHNKPHLAFLDSVGRAWQWNFIPKDMPVSEWSMYNNLKLRFDYFKKQLGDRIIHRSDVVLVMGVDQLDLMRYATAVVFVTQTKPWFREFDLWKSFVNVDLRFLEGLDPFWLD